MNIFTEYVNIYLGDAGLNLFGIFLPECSNTFAGLIISINFF